jgi:predicted Fe-Mo cluster-binding NifX family protein
MTRRERTAMRICIPTLDDRGLRGVPSDHFGSAPFFTFVDTDSEDMEVQKNAGAHHVHGACRPLDFLGTQKVDAIACRGLGKRAFSRLRDGGIGVFLTFEKDVEATVRAYTDGRLRQLTSEEACHGHAHGHNSERDDFPGWNEDFGRRCDIAPGSGAGTGRSRGGGYGYQNR